MLYYCSIHFLNKRNWILFLFKQKENCDQNHILFSETINKSFSQSVYFLHRVLTQYEMGYYLTIVYIFSYYIDNLPQLKSCFQLKKIYCKSTKKSDHRSFYSPWRNIIISISSVRIQSRTKTFLLTVREANASRSRHNWGSI